MCYLKRISLKPPTSPESINGQHLTRILSLTSSFWPLGKIFQCILEPSWQKKHSENFISETWWNRLKKESKWNSVIFRQRKLICRVIKFDRLTSYLIDDWYKEFRLMLSLPTPNILKVEHVFVEKNKMYIIMGYEISLFQYLHIDKVKFGILEKLDIWIQLSSVLQALHELDKPVHHLHLWSRNVFIKPIDTTPDQQPTKYLVKLGDIGDLEIRQYKKIFSKYEIRNAWSPPEILANSDMAFSDPHATMDVYSFGMLLWEIFSSGK